MISNLGIMQGRLSKPLNGKIQSFPKYSWKKEFNLAKKLSFKFLEWTLDYEDLDKNPLMMREIHPKIKALSKKYNIKIKSITGDCFMQKPFWKTSNSHLKLKLLKDLKNIIINASNLKIKFLIIPLVDAGSIKNREQEKTLVFELSKFKKILKKNKLQILFETDLNPKKNSKFMKKFNSNHFGINYDTGNSASLNFDPIQEFKEYGKYIKNIHLKDRKKFGKTVPFGQGNANFKLIFNLCKKINFKGNMILQGARKSIGKEEMTIRQYLKFISRNSI